MADETRTLIGAVLEEELTLIELCRYADARAEELVLLVEEGLLEPRGDRPETWRFDPASSVRVRRALRLARELEIELTGAALAADLLEELERLRTRIRALEYQSREGKS